MTMASTPEQILATDGGDISTKFVTYNAIRSLVTNVFVYIVRLYLICFIMVFGWIKKIVYKCFAPLEPIAAQVRKVPKKDVSIEGILYQFFRLQFLVLLYMAPWINKSFAYFTEPFGRLAHRVLDWAGLDDQIKTRKTQD